MTFDWNVSVGNVLTAVGLLVGFYVAHTQNIRRLENIEVRLGLMYTWFTRHIVGRDERE